jgi:excisionase family DNA binding protein
MGADLGRKEWFTTDELIRWLRLGRTKTYELLRTGEIPSYKIGRVRRIRRGDVEAWLERNRYPPEDAGLSVTGGRRRQDR